MGRVLLKCQSCGGYFATGLNIGTGQDTRRKFSFKLIPYRCTACGVEREYSSDDLVDEGQGVKSAATRKPGAPAEPQRKPKNPG